MLALIRPKVQILGEDAARLKVLSLAKRARNLSPLFRGAITTSIHRFFRKQFSTQGQEGGDPWDPLSLATERIKSNIGRSHGVLQRSRRLWASLTKRNGPESINKVTAHSVEVGTIVPWAMFHQKGYTQTNVWNRARQAALKVRPRKLVPDEMPGKYVKGWERLIVRYMETGAR